MDNRPDFNSAVYKRSRKAYMAQCTFEYFITILVADAFLAKLLTHIGLSDGLIGIISSFITLAFMFQLLSIFVAKRITSPKKTVIILHTVFQLFFFGLYIIPFLPFSTSIKTVLVMGSIILAYISNYTSASILYKWANSFVSPDNRGRYSAVKEMISLFTGIAFTLIMGYIIDKYEAIGNIEGGFLLISVTILILTVANFVSLILIKDKKTNIEKESGPSVKDIVKNTLGNRNFRNVIIMTILWDVCRYMTIGFLGVFKTKDLLLSVGAVQIINMIANLGRMAVSIPFGAYSDRTSFASGIKVSFILAALAFGFNMFTTRETWWIIIIYTVLHNMSIAGNNQNSFNIAYSYVKEEYFVPALAIKNSIGGLFGFGATLIGSKILTMVQENGNTFMGIPMFGQQLLSGISFVIAIALVLFVHFVIEKQKVIKQ